MAEPRRGVTARVQALPQQPPHSIEAEQSVLGGLMVKNDLWPQLMGSITADDFYRADHQVIFRAITELIDAGKACDFVTLSERLRPGGRLDEVGGPEYLASLATDTYSIANINSYAEIIRERAMRRRVIALCAEVGEMAFGKVDASALTAELSAGLEKLQRGAGLRSLKFSDLLAPTEAYLREARARREAGGIMGVPSGIPALDNALGGFYGPRLYGIAARPGLGKTALLNQIAFHATARGEPGFIASLEMGGEELMIRALSAHSQQNFTKLMRGYDAECERAIETAARMGDLPLWLDTESYELNAIIGQIAVHRHRHGIEWAAVDHIGLIQTEKFNSRNDQIGHITAQLKRAAKRIGIPIIALIQLSRAAEKEGRQPGLHDLRDSGNIEQDLDTAIFLHSTLEQRKLVPRPLQIGILKSRTCPSAWMEHRFEFDGRIQTFHEIVTAYGPAPTERSGVDL